MNRKDVSKTNGIVIREEKPTDFPAVFQLITSAFKNEIQSTHTEQFLVEKLRKSKAFIPELSLIAELKERVVGYLLLTRITIESNTSKHDALALAPIAVLQEYQKKGVGSLLIEEAHERAKTLGYTAIVVVGHQTYYPKFGYKKAEEFSIKLPFEVPSENAMAIELVPDALKNVNGTVVYDHAFYE